MVVFEGDFNDLLENFSEYLQDKKLCEKTEIPEIINAVRVLCDLDLHKETDNDKLRKVLVSRGYKNVDFYIKVRDLFDRFILEFFVFRTWP